MSKEKQIEEMAREMCHLSAECKTCQICNERYHGDDDDLCYFKCVAKEIINHGYRKQSEGEWKQAYNSFPRYVCTNCNHLFNNKSFKYCPNCGAKMKGGAE
jgi:hypothetical protein